MKVIEPNNPLKHTEKHEKHIGRMPLCESFEELFELQKKHKGEQ